MEALIDFIRNHPEQVNAFAAVSALILSLIVSFLSICLTVYTLRIQREHNFKSLSPIGAILTPDYEGELGVVIRNVGVGPLIVERLTVSGGAREVDNLPCLMPPRPEGIKWSTYSLNITGRCITPNQEITLLQLNGEPGDEPFASFSREVRLALSRLTVTLEYKDIYERSMPPSRKQLGWFVRDAPQPPGAVEDRAGDRGAKGK